MNAPRCWATHNPGRWPYVARCVKQIPHIKRGDTKHRDQYGNEWEEETEE